MIEMKSVLSECDCCTECERGEAVVHKYYLTFYRPFLVSIGDKEHIVFSNPGFSSRVDIMEAGGKKSVACSDRALRKNPKKKLTGTQELLLAADNMHFSWPLHMPLPSEVHAKCREDTIVYNPDGKHCN
jgi:hypothetical protein